MSAGIRAGSSNDGYVQVNGNDIITALSGGNVGIGNTSPSTKLHVNGTITATNFIGAFSGNSNISVDDWIVHTGDTDTKLGFSTADTISFHTAGTEVLKITSTGNLELPNNNDYIKLGSGGPFNFVYTGTGAFISNSSGFLTHQCDTHQFKKGDGSVEYFRSNNTGVAIGHVSPVRKFSVKSTAANTIAISLLDNDSTNEIWRVGQAADGDGYVEVLEDGGTVGCKLDASGNSFTMGNFGVGVASPNARFNLKLPSRGNSGFRITDSDTTSDVLRAGSQADGDGFFQLRTIAGAGNVLLDSSGVSYIAGGNFGIGLTSPAKKLQVKEASSTSGVHYLAHVGGSSHLANYAVGLGFDPEGYTARTKIAIVAEGTAAGYSRGKLHFLLDAANDSGEATLSESRMTILDSGNVGIGVTSPSTALEVKGDITVYNANNQGDIFFGEHGDVADSKALIRMDQISGTAGQLEFHTESGGTLSKRLTIASDGDVLINQPAEASGRLTIKGTNSNGSSCYVATDSGKAREGIDVTSTTVGDGNYGGAVSFGCGGNGRSAIAAVQSGSDDDVNGLAFFTHDSNVGANDTVERLQINPDGNIKIRDPGSNAGGCLYSRFGSITNISSTSWTNILQFNNEVGVWLITVTIQTDANQHSSWAGILCKGAYDNNLSQLGATADHYNQGYLLVQMSGDAATAYIQVKMSTTPGSGTCRCRALRLANLLG